MISNSTSASSPLSISNVFFSAKLSNFLLPLLIFFLSKKPLILEEIWLLWKEIAELKERFLTLQEILAFTCLCTKPHYVPNIYITTTPHHKYTIMVSNWLDLSALSNNKLWEMLKNVDEICIRHNLEISASNYYIGYRFWNLNSKFFRINFLKE